MEPLYPWLMLVAGLLVGALIGGAVMMTMERRSRGSEHDVRQVRRELDDYRNEVAEHYAETAKRVNGLTHAYKDVYDHLERGAYRLVGEPELRRRLDDAEPRPVTLEGIGGRGLQRPREEREGSPAGERPGRDEADERPKDAATTGAATAGLGAASARPVGTVNGGERTAATSTGSGTASRTAGASRTTSTEEDEREERTPGGVGSTTEGTEDDGAAVAGPRDGTAYRSALGAEDDETTDGEPRVYPRKETEVEGEERSDETTGRRA